MTYLSIYMVLCLLVAIWYIKNERDWFHAMFVILFPVVFFIIALDEILKYFGWKFDIEGSTYKKGRGLRTWMFDFRTGSNVNVKGFAITIFYLEFQFWRNK